MAQEIIQWTSPSPLWSQAVSRDDLLARQKLLRQPAILRFASDEFMDQFLALLENDPAKLSGLVAKPETWRGAYKEPEPVKEAPAFARKLNRLGLIAARSKNPPPGAGSAQPSAAAPISGPPEKKAPRFKLYQPAHQRYYLVTACLVCGRAGLPDRAIAPVRQERVGFVVRRLMPAKPLNIKEALPEMNPGEWPKDWDEYAFVVAPDGQGWKRIQKEKRDELEEGEEQLPLFALHFAEDDGRRRRLFAGLVPVGRREDYTNASQRPQAGDPAPVVTPPALPDPRMILVWSQITEPWKQLIERADAARIMQGINPLPTDPPTTSKDEPLSNDAAALYDSLKATREQIQTGSWYALLDLAMFLEEHIGNVWRQLHGQTPQPPLTPAQDALVNALTDTILSSNQLKTELRKDQSLNLQVAGTLKEALTLVRPADATAARLIESNLDSVAVSYSRQRPAGGLPTDPKWPTFLFPLADSQFEAPLPPATPGDEGDPNNLADRLKRIDRLAKLIEAALPPQSQGEAPALPLAAKPVMDRRESWFVMRCVFERPQCGPIDPPLLSDPTEPFQMAGFFDPDAPARPIRIALPVDTTPAGLRKFNKNTAFMISDVLCGQIDRAKGLSLGDLVRSVLPWPLHKDLSAPDKGPCKSSDPSLTAGMICSLSLPIITICALIVLMIIVTLLDIIFRWIPYFILCFPIPGFKAKE